MTASEQHVGVVGRFKVGEKVRYPGATDRHMDAGARPLSRRDASKLRLLTSSTTQQPVKSSGHHKIVHAHHISCDTETPHYCPVRLVQQCCYRQDWSVYRTCTAMQCFGTVRVPGSYSVWPPSEPAAYAILRRAQDATQIVRSTRSVVMERSTSSPAPLSGHSLGCWRHGREHDTR